MSDYQELPKEDIEERGLIKQGTIRSSQYSDYFYGLAGLKKIGANNKTNKNAIRKNLGIVINVNGDRSSHSQQYGNTDNEGNQGFDDNNPRHSPYYSNQRRHEEGEGGDA